MRNCVLAMIGEIVLRELSVDGLDDKSRDLRDELLDILEGLIHDINAFTRSRALQMWTRIVTEKVKSFVHTLYTYMCENPGVFVVVGVDFLFYFFTLSFSP